MRVIILEDKDSIALIEQLELAKLKARRDPSSMNPFKKEDVKWTIDDVHRWFHYHVVRWLQDQGCEVIRK